MIFGFWETTDSIASMLRRTSSSGLTNSYLSWKVNNQRRNLSDPSQPATVTWNDGWIAKFGSVERKFREKEKARKWLDRYLHHLGHKVPGRKEKKKMQSLF